jgi:hypothetical protein
LKEYNLFYRAIISSGAKLKVVGAMILDLSQNLMQQAKEIRLEKRRQQPTAMIASRKKRF